jgi:lipopolysaccharide transport system ATP-binding protein
LLKLLSRITLPTEGIIGMKGKVSSLLEVGTGFHPELTGGRTSSSTGAILGMRKAEVEEAGGHRGLQWHRAPLGHPVKRYSSGMRVRLGFCRGRALWNPKCSSWTKCFPWAMPNSSARAWAR